MRARTILTIVFSVSLLAIGCTGSGSNNGGSDNNSNNQNNGDNNDDNNGEADAGGNNGVPDGGAPDGGDDDMGIPCEDRPYNGNVNFKKGRRFNADLAQALSLPEDEVCTELGEFNCAGFVHRVSLGDPEPYAAGVYEGSPVTTISTTLIIERMAMSGCINRVDRDLSGGDAAVIFQKWNAATMNPEAEEASAAITKLYQGFLLRNPSPTELEHVQGFYAEVVDGGSAQAGRDWAVLSCFAIASSIESTFY